ncbi:hypothetical protein EW026_g7100 [Hermanssonia centrifuga]|uniref:SSD domain-containing protein n=1 Tax=Hermanssonia centrifuga TaxID=98765 RepID=A0A4S4K8W5_9APHY|nr:hypothetical protein EW026_g7100 [Hermanssonia centrifuga]
MLSAPSSILQRVRTFGSRFFHRFGIHCATHQIRVILISSVVISSLLYPAIAVYSSSQTHFFTFSLRVLDAFLTPDDLSGYFSHEDLRHLWDGYDALRVREDSIARARCGKEGIIRTERILIHHIHEDDEKGPLNHGILLETLKLERRISDLLSSRRVQCVRTSEKRCLSLSPLAFWDYDEKLLLNDENILETLGPSQNATVSGVTITPDMVLAGRGAAESTASDSDATLFLVLTYFFPDTDCLANHGHFTWLDILEEAASSDGDLIMQAQQPRLVALEVDAVIKTSIALPVKERIAEGLSRAGVIAFFSSGAIRQFCAFAIVVLVAHWFLVHTFFVTVLSIDIQRLELDELLRQNASLAPVLSVEPQKSDVRQAQTKWGRTVAGIHSLLRGRAGKNISLVLLLAVTATLYYMTKPIPTTNSELRDSSRSPFVRLAKPPIPGSVSPSMQIWRTLNPTNFDLVHIRIESPAILVMGRDINPLTSEDAGAERQRLEYEKAQRARWSRVWSRTGRNVTWLFKTVAVPTVGTTVVLWGLLLYLLKDAELLEAQRNRAEPDSPVTEDAVPAVEGHVTFTTLPRAFPTDVDLIAASKDGSVIAT